ncbi:MAG: hypothetical protein PHR56_05400 [Dehalococcoidales bacterium]|nr:hypothetical protein [Dehalococcoidales bacterium]
MKSIMRQVWLLTLLVTLVISAGCQPAPATQGPQGQPGSSTGTVSGTVTNVLTGKPVSGVQVVTDPAISGVTITTNAAGSYSATLPIGIYTLKYQKANFNALSQTVSLVAGQTFTKNAILQPVSRVVTAAGNDQASSPGASVTLEASADTLDGSTVTSYQWTQVSGVTASIESPRERSTKVTLSQLPAYKEKFMTLLEKLERVDVQAVNPHELEAAETCVFRVTVNTSSGSYTDMVNITVPLPYAVAPGLRNVPAGIPVLLHGKTQNSYNWTLTAPAGSKANLADAASRYPSFTPDVSGEYIVAEQGSAASLKVYAGTWQGAVSGMDDKGRPLAATCTTCHDGEIAKDQFTAWKESGHAEVFTQNLNTGGHYGEDCFSCHTVGFDKTVKNAGFDDASDYNAFLNAGLLNKPDPNNWATVMSKFPETARMANIQCENCHGPNNHAALHPDNTPASARISIASDVCASCHGEPPRHARFQQWDESGHANFELAIDEGSVETRGASAGHCGRCHTGQGFLAWIQQPDQTKRIQGAKGDATADELKALGLTKDTVQPITCATCHDPHNPGTVSGKPNNTTVRIQGNTSLLPAGFQARNVGRGAICIMCHNTRGGLHNDSNLPTSYSAPHVSAQGDVLLGENAYLVRPRQRSPHASITDSCVRCHMEVTPPPPELSYQLAGTNHAFKASLKLCSSCHSDVLDAAAFQSSYKEQLEELGLKMGQYLLSKLTAQVTVKDYTPHTYNGVTYDLKSDGIVINKTNIVSVEPVEPHGQQGFLIKFKEAVNFTYAPAGQQPHSLALNQIEVQLGDITTDGKTAIITLSDVLVRAGWNYFLIHGDASSGIHNPDFVEEVLSSSIEALFPTKVPQESE